MELAGMVRLVPGDPSWGLRHVHQITLPRMECGVRTFLLFHGYSPFPVMALWATIRVAPYLPLQRPGQA